MKEYRACAACMGITLMPWQEIGAESMMATGLDGWLYPEFAGITSRRNGKTELLLPRLHDDMDRGRHVIHTAQNRTLPRQVYMRMARHYEIAHPNEVVHIKFGSGMEEIELRNGATYTIVAPQRGARGLGADTFILDELREFESDDILGAAVPTLGSSPDPQRIYLSNAGSDASVVLNDLKRRGEEGGDDMLAYLEWSAAPERSIDDRAGWLEANPAIGQPAHPAGKRMMQTLEEDYRSLSPQRFETEHLCRWVISMQPRLVSEEAWMRCQSKLEQPNRPAMAFNTDPSGKRASAAMSWQQTDGRIALVEVSEATGDPIDLPSYGADLKELKTKHGIHKVAFASWTDKDLARYIPGSEPLDAKEFANASENFARLIMSGRLAWEGASHITDDLSWTARKAHLESGAWTAVAATPERSITAVLAAIRATWLASAPRQLPRIG